MENVRGPIGFQRRKDERAIRRQGDVVKHWNFKATVCKVGVFSWVLWVPGVLWPFPIAGQDTLSIYDVQFSTAQENWRSAYEGDIVSIAGGVVTHQNGSRITLQDPTLGDAWAGIEIRAFENEAPLGIVSAGDRVDFFDVLVEEFRGGTIPQFMDYSTFEVVSSGNPLPAPVHVPVHDLRLPPDREACEKYEGMVVAVENVRVGRLDLGKAEDNYEIFTEADTMWASDYCNHDIQVPPFPTYFVSRGERYARMAGVFQEYRHPDEGWDYYQILPRGSADYEESDLYTIRDVQESSEADGWASRLTGARIRLRGIVSSECSGSERMTLADPLLGTEWAGVFLDDVVGRLSSLTLGDDVEFSNVQVDEADGLTLLLYDGESDHSIVSRGNAVTGSRASPGDLSLAADPDRSEKYEGMLISLYNTTVVGRGTLEDPDLYCLVAGSDTLLGTDLESAVLAPDSTFFVRNGDRLGRLRGLVTERKVGAESRYILQPRAAEDYTFVGSNRELTSWGRVKRQFRQVKS